jgi:hypothetical protein
MIVGDPVVGVQKANSSVAFRCGQQGAQPARRAAEIVVRDVEPQVPDRFAIDPLLGKTVSDNNMVDRNRLTPDTAKAPFQLVPCFPEVGCNDGVSAGRRSASSGHLLVMKRRKPRIIDARGLPGALMVARQSWRIDLVNGEVRVLSNSCVLIFRDLAVGEQGQAEVETFSIVANPVGKNRQFVPHAVLIDPGFDEGPLLRRA